MRPKQSIDWKNEWFPIDDATYLNFAAHAAIPRVALIAVQASVAAKIRPHIVDDLSFFSVAASLRQSLATLIGASPDEIALTTCAGAGLAAIAYALTWSAGVEVIIAQGEFPVQYATWKPVEAREGIKVQIVVPKDQFIQADDLIAAMTPRTRVISVSHVRFDDGSMLDVPSLAAVCKRNGTLLVLDVSQSFVRRIVKLLVMVNGAPNFTEPHRVADGASGLLVQVFGERGIHPRSAVSVAQVPFGACVEIEMIAELRAAQVGGSV